MCFFNLITAWRSADVPLAAVSLSRQLRCGGAGTPVPQLFAVVARTAERLLRTVLSDLRQHKSE